jgi:uncharacterized protein (DUF302 family)
VNHRGNWKELRIGFDDAVARLPEVLQAEGFGVLTQIDVQQTLKAKLGVDFRRYRIFGACNPSFAHRALEADPRAGVLLPCNVVLYERDDHTAVLGIIDPMQQLGDADDQRLSGLARAVDEKLRRVAIAMDA